MSARTILTAALLVFVIAGVAYVAFEPGHETVRAAPAAAPATAGGHKVLVYYFHGDRRCATCRRIEAWAEAAVREAFGPRLASGELEWRVVNVDRDGNAHFAEDFELLTSSVVVVDTLDGRTRDWRNLDQVWMLASEPAAFRDYVVSGVRAYVGTKP